MAARSGNTTDRRTGRAGSLVGAAWWVPLTAGVSMGAVASPLKSGTPFIEMLPKLHKPYAGGGPCSFCAVASAALTNGIESFSC